MSEILHKCVACRKKFKSNEVSSVGGNVVCKSCVEKLTKKCCYCGKTIWKNNSFTKKLGGRFYCSHCYSILHTCKHCNKKLDIRFDNVHLISSQSIFNKDIICEDCYKNVSICDDCNHAVDEVVTIQLHNGSIKKVCKRCLGREYTICRHCQNYFKNEEIVWFQMTPFCVYNCINLYAKKCEYCSSWKSIHDNNKFCSNCVEKIIIKNYSYKPVPYFHCTPFEEDKFFFGVELEIQGEDRDGFLKQIYPNDFFYFKKDASISFSSGVEIVSHPATLKYHKTHQWGKLFELLNHYNMTDTAGCGLHFHVNRNGFENPSAIRFLDYFVNNNEKDLSCIGGREFSTFCRKREKTSEDWGMCYTSNHHDCLNVSNENTIEFRFCKSTSDYAEFLKRLILISNLSKFAEKIANDIQNDDIFLVNYSDFKSFCR